MAPTTEPNGERAVFVRVISDAGNLTWLLNGRPVSAPAHRRTLALPVGNAVGQLRITVLDPSGAADTVTVTLDSAS